MAGTFGSDPQVAGQVSRELAEIRSDMGMVGRLFEGYGGATGSARVESALEEFFSGSSDSREAMGRLLERASGLLRGLAEGTVAVDTALAEALEPEGAPPPRNGPASDPRTGRLG